MQTVCLNILQIIETVDGAGYEAERCEDNERWPQKIPLQQIVAEEDRRKDEHVLEPLQWAQQLDVLYHRVQRQCKSNEMQNKLQFIFISEMPPIFERSSKIVQNFD